MPVWSECRDPSVIKQHRHHAAWRAGFGVMDRAQMVLPIPFATRQDAEACCAIMRGKIPHPHTTTLREFRAKFVEAFGDLQAGCDELVALSCRW